MTTPRKPPFQFGLATLMRLTAGAALFTWAWLLFLTPEGLAWLVAMAASGAAGWGLARVMVPKSL